MFVNQRKYCIFSHSTIYSNSHQNTPSHLIFTGLYYYLMYIVFVKVLLNTVKSHVLCSTHGLMCNKVFYC